MTKSTNYRLISIYASSTNHIIGDKNDLLWRFSSDFKHFKNLTNGHSMIMGRKTFESLPGVLPGREHLILSRNEDFKIKNPDCKNVKVFTSLNDLNSYINEKLSGDIFVIGGAEIYELFEPYVSVIWRTEICENYEGDTKYEPKFSSFDNILSKVIEDTDKKSGELMKIIFRKYVNIYNN